MPSQETSTSSSVDELFSVECPALKEKVLMLKETWFGHLLNPKTGHPYMAGKADLIKRAIQSITSKNRFFRFSDCPPNEWFADYECPDFLPQNPFLRVAFKKIDIGMIVSSAYKVPRGIINYEP